MKKTICLILVFCCVFFCGITSAYAEEEEEILFNGIPWGSTYKETISILKQKYNVDFAGQDDLVKQGYLLSDFDTLYLRLMYNYTNDRIGFSVISKSPVQIAEEDAYIFLDFAFPNNGTDVLYDDYENAAFIHGYYLFCIEPADESYTTVARTFLRRYSVFETDLSYFEKKELYDKLHTLIENKYGDAFKMLERLEEKKPSVYVKHYKGTDAFEFWLNIDGSNRLCELDAVVINYSPYTTGENDIIIREQNEAARIAYEQKKTDEILAIDSSGL